MAYGIAGNDNYTEFVCSLVPAERTPAKALSKLQLTPCGQSWIFNILEFLKPMNFVCYEYSFACRLFKSESSHRAVGVEPTLLA